MPAAAATAAAMFVRFAAAGGTRPVFHDFQFGNSAALRAGNLITMPPAFGTGFHLPNMTAAYTFKRSFSHF
jgi:hypothetical protein